MTLHSAFLKSLIEFCIQKSLHVINVHLGIFLQTKCNQHPAHRAALPVPHETSSCPLSFTTPISHPSNHSPNFQHHWLVLSVFVLYKVESFCMYSFGSEFFLNSFTQHYVLCDSSILWFSYKSCVLIAL